MIYIATIRTATGKTWHIAADTTDQDAKLDLRTVAMEATRMPAGMIRLHDVKRTIRKTIDGWDVVKSCRTHDTQWGWIQY
jgi:hypothetical protein